VIDRGCGECLYLAASGRGNSRVDVGGRIEAIDGIGCSVGFSRRDIHHNWHRFCSSYLGLAKNFVESMDNNNLALCARGFGAIYGFAHD